MKATPVHMDIIEGGPGLRTPIYEPEWRPALFEQLQLWYALQGICLLGAPGAGPKAFSPAEVTERYLVPSTMLLSILSNSSLLRESPNIGQSHDALLMDPRRGK